MSPAAKPARRRSARPGRAGNEDTGTAATLRIRAARRGDLDRVTAIDATVTGLEKAAYWTSIYRRYGAGAKPERAFLVAELDRRVVGFVIGEIRDWEFGAPPCGWVFAIDVDPGARLGGIGTRLLESIGERFRAAGVTKLRTMLARDNTLILSFFRSQGMMAGAFIPLEMDIEPARRG
ncbi:MAG: GNAT family N-acetyltransferase [Caldimonas sp.]